MAKDSKPKAAAGGIRKVPWRDAEVFGCPSCSYHHERKDRVEQHMRAGRHQVPRTEGPTAATGATEPNAGAPQAQEPGKGGE